MDSATAALLADAVRLHRQGTLAEAAERYAQVLRGDPADALASYDRVIALKPDFAEVHFNRGNALARLGRQDEALASFGQLLAAAPGHVSALLSCGDVLRKLARHAEALTSYRRALAIDP